MATLDGILVSRKAAQRRNLKVGDVFTLMVGAGVRADGSNSWPFKVLAIVPDDPERPHGYMLGPCLLGAATGTWVAAVLTTLPTKFVPQGFGIPEATVSSSVFASSLAAAAVLALISSAFPLLKLWRRHPAELLAAG